MSTIDREPGARAARLSVPSLQEIFWGPLATRIRRVAQWRKRGALGKAHAHMRRAMRFEPLEQRLLLSADFTPAAADAIGDGFDKLADRVTILFNGDNVLDDRMPILLKASTDADGNPVYEAPSIQDLLSVPVNANGDLDSNGDPIIDGPFGSDDDEAVLDGLDINHDGTVDTAEFLRGWFFEPIADHLHTLPSGTTTTDFTDYLKGSLLFNLDHTLTQFSTPLYPSSISEIKFEIVDAKVSDTTENPDAEFTFSVGFKLSVSQSMPIDLGLTADALQITPFQTGTDANPKAPTVPVTSALSFAFDFGALTGGKSVIGAQDFFIRKAEPMVASVKSDVPDIPDFSLNIGFLGAKVVDGSLDLQANVNTALLDPNDPDVLGFTDAQLGVEQTSGTVVAANPLASAELGHSAGFFLRVGNLGIATPISVADNNSDSDPLSAVIADIQAALPAGLADIVGVSLDGTDRVRFDLVDTSSNPLGFGDETAGEGISGALLGTPNGDGGTDFEYLSDQTFLLSVGGGVPKLVRVSFPDPSHTDIGFNDNQHASVPPLTAPNAASPFDITGQADFIVTAWTSDGTPHAPYAFSLSATDTDGNASAADLAADIQNKLAGSSVSGLVTVSADSDGHIRFVAAGSTSAIRVQASGTATSEIGFAADATVGLRLLGAGGATADLSEAANFKLTLNYGGAVDTYAITVPDNNRGSLGTLAQDINDAIDAAIGADRINAYAVGSQILLAGNNTAVRAFSVRTVNQDIGDLVADVNRALDKAGLGAQVTAMAFPGDMLELVAAGGKSLEISHTLTFDAGVTYTELAFTPTDHLFGVVEDTAASHVKIKLPVHVLPGLYDDVHDVANWNPANVAIVGNFDPFESAAAQFVGSPTNRFDLLFGYTPGVEDQDLPPIPVPSVNSLSNQILLVNFGEVLNFNIVGAESMIGLLGGLGTALQQLSETPTFSNYGIPFADATLSDLMNFADGDKTAYSGLIDMLLFDTGGDGVDGSNADHDGLLKKISANGTSYLIPAFTTAQTLATRLDALLDGPLTGAGGINATYNTQTNELTYQLDLRAGDRTAVDATVSFEHDVPLDPFSKLGIDTSVPAPETSVELRGRTGLDLTFGVDLSLPGVVIYPETPLAELNGLKGIDIRTERAVTGEAGVRSVYGITKDSKFKISVDGGLKYDVMLSADATNNNTLLGNLVADLQGAINLALNGTAYAGKVQVGLDAATLTRLGMQHADGAGHTIQIYVDSSDPFVTELGFPNRLTSGVPTPFSILIAQKAAPLLVGRLSGLPTDKATFEIDILKNIAGLPDLAPPVAVQVSVAQTEGNVSPGDLVADVNNALAAAHLDGIIKAAYDNSSVQGTRLVLVADDGIDATDDSRVEFTVRATNSKAHLELGLPNAATAADQADFVIYDRAGNAHRIVLDATKLDRSNPAYDPLDGLPNDPTVDDLIKVINAYFPDPDDGGPLEPLVIASLNDLHTGLKLVTTATTGTHQFRVETINDSPALLGMGLFLTGDDRLPDTFGNGDPNLIAGGSIGLTSLDQRFFVRNAQMRIDGLEVETPDAGVPGQGLYGIVGVDVNVNGGLMANVTAQLTDPDNTDGKGQITLAELLDKETGGTVATPIVSPVVELNYDDQADSPFSEFEVGGRLLGSAAGDSAVIVGVRNDSGGGDSTGTLLLAHVTGTFSDNEQIIQYFPSALPAGAYANGAPSPAADFGHDIDLTVRVQPGFDDDPAFDPDFQALDNAPYVVKFDITTFGNGIVPAGTNAFDLSPLGNLQPFDKLSYTHFQSVLHDLLAVIDDVYANFEELTLKLPAINRSVSDLLGFVEPFARGVDNADAAFGSAITAIGPEGMGLPPLTLQQMGSALRGAYGLPDEFDPADTVLLDYDPGADELRVSLVLHEEVSTKLGLDIDPGGGGAHLTSAGVLKVNGTLDTQLDVAIDLTQPGDAYLLDSSRIDGALHVQGEGQEYSGSDPGLGMVFRSTAGPLAVFIQDGDAQIDFAFSLPGLDFGPGLTRKLLSDVVYADFKPKQISADHIEIVLPMFFGGEGPDDYIGDYTALGTVGSNTVNLPPDLATITAQITGGTLEFDPFENILLGIDALDLYLETLSDQMAGDVLSTKLPFIGDQMADVLFIEDFRGTLVGALKDGIENTINPTPETVTGILEGLFAIGGALYGYGIGPVVVTSNTGGDVNSRYRQWNFTIGRTGTNADTITIDDFDIGPDNMGFDVFAPVTVTMDWSIALGFGLNYGDGAYIDTSGSDELNVDLTMHMPGDMTTNGYDGQLGFMRLDVTDPGGDSGVHVAFDVDVTNGGVDENLAFADMGSLDPIAMLSGDGLNGAQAITFHLQTNAAPGLPDLRADLVFDWQMLTPMNVASLGGDAVNEYITLIELNDMKLDAYSAVKKLLGPAFDEIAKYIDPFMPVVDTLTAPIPILSDLAGEPFTLLDLAAIFGEVNPDFIDAVADILDVISLVSELANDGGPLLPLGSLTLYNSDPGNHITNFDPTDPTSRLSDITITKDDLDPGDIPGLTHDKNAYKTELESDPTHFLEKVRDGELADGLSMPILTEAGQGIMLLLGNPKATLVQYQLPSLGVSFDYLQTFPVWGPLAVSIEINFGFTLALHSVGFDTYGYMRYADAGFRNPGLIFDGFFFSDTATEGGPDVPEISFEFGLVGAAELNLGIARAGVGGGIEATINFDWHDSIPDGHVHISELIGNVIAENGNPLAIFDVSGELTFEMFAFLEISLLGIDKEFPITPKTELFSFNESFDRAPLLATQVGDTLYLNMGPNARDRLNGDTSDGNETMSLEYDSGTVKVWSVPLGVGHGDAQSFTGVNHIVGLGGEGNDTITLDGFDGSHITGDFDGGVGDDRIEYLNTSASNDWEGARIVGGLGNDILTGGDANDVIYGGEGNDIINGSGGYDILFGDQGRVADTVSTPFISSRITETDGNDKMDGGAGDDVVIGAGGSDELKGGAGNDLLIGDGGRFEYSKSGNHVNVLALEPAPYVPAPVVTPTPDSPEKISADIDALYDFVVERIRATELGLGGNDKIDGGGDNDLILGGSGDDILNGDDGADIILGGKGFDDVHGGAGNDTIFGGDQADTLHGDDGADVMAGGAGNDYMHGDAGNDVMKGDTGADIMFGDADDDQLFGLTEPDVLFGGIGNDLVVGGTGNDIMFGDDGVVAKLDPTKTDGSGNSKIIGIGSVDLTGAFRDADIRTLDLIETDVVAGDGNDIMSGEAGDDIMLGGGGNDLMGGDVDPRLPSAGTDTAISEDVLIGDGGKITFDQRQFRTIATVIGTATGAPFNDVIYGDNGNDYIFGGRGNDFLFGGHGKVVDVATESVEGFRGPTDGNADDNDVIVGDNGEMLFAGMTPVASNFGKLKFVGTTDMVNGTGGHEYAEGELGDDVIFGGVNGSVDVLYGNVGDDVILGDNGWLDFDYNDPAHDLSTLDLIHSKLDGLGGTDAISGNAGYDVLIGGTGGDEMYGDDATASAGADDGEDIMLGDNADIFLIGTEGRLKVRVTDMPVGTAVDLITTTDVSDAYGGADTMSGNAMADVMLGGVNAGGEDHLYGDRASPNSTTIANDGDDILLGDNGRLDFTYGPDTDRNTLDLIRSYEDGYGGTDRISGDKGLDVAIGGTGDDFIYGDDAAASGGANDLGDLLLGDNADVFLVAPLNLGTGSDLKLVLDAAVKTIRTTDEEHPEYGGVDTISGNAGGDIIAGGVAGDTLYGDAASVVPALDGDDIILGDNGAFEWLSTGRLGEIHGIDIQANNPDLYDKYHPGVADTDLTTLDLVTTEQPTSGGRDTIYGDEGSDFVFGGTDLDWIYGDDGNGVAEVPGSANSDVLFGDHGRIYPQFSTLSNFNSRNFFAIDTGNGDGGEGDIMYGEEGDDSMLGQQGDDRMWGGSGDDDMTGGHNVSGGRDELALPAVQATLNPPMNDLMDGGSGDDAMAGDNAIVWRRGDDLSPRFRTLAGSAIYTTSADGVDVATITANVGGIAQSDPDDAVGRDIELLDHADTTPAGLYGADVMAGGADSDVMFGQLGDDLMQGDGNIGADDMDPDFITRHVGVTDSGAPATGEDLYFNVPELASDADDYMEGNGGNDLMYGGLGQDDMIGGSSNLFGLDTEDERPDGSDIIFGGAGAPARLARNDFVGSSDTDHGTAEGVGAVPTGDDPSIALADRHARDADFIMGDNANVFRLVGAGDAFLTFNYDKSTAYENRGAERIVVRAMEQLDYTLGGSDYAGGAYVNGAAQRVGQPADNGAGDLIHGESGDDYIFGMTGSDTIFGESDDDDIVGGYGNDWISGGTGQDGVIGDDGLVYTSRNSTEGEPLYGVAGLLASDANLKYNNGDALNETISTPGETQIALINVEGQLKKTADLVPFSFDKTWVGMDDEFPDDASNTPYADDIIFGGLGSDFLHGGSGDDAISGAEALEHAYVPTFDGEGNADGVLDLGYDAFDLTPPVNPGDTVSNPNPGDVLAFNPVDLDGRHLNNRFRAGEFFLYDEYDPRLKIMLGGDGELLWKSTKPETAYEFLLNFDQTEGVWRSGGDVPKATGQQTPTYGAVNDDGKDSIFGDLGNDWLVGGTGRDNLYGGWGNDLLNADDDLTTHGAANDQPDTHPYYEDRAYGGAGRDVLIGNTGGDRLIDWVGEYNSFLVPYAPFGQASVSRTLMPHLQEFLYALSAGDGADFTRYADAIGGTPPAPTSNDPIPSRNGEPFGELGLVLQKDFAWGDQTGAPADPQAGNIPGGKRDVLRTAGFNDGTLTGFAVDSGSFSVVNGKLSVAAESLGLDATAVLPLDDQLPGYYEVLAAVSVEKPTAGWKANSYVVFDYYDDQDFKYAGINISTNKVEVGYRDATGWHVVKDSPQQLKAGTSYNLMLAINGTNVTLVLDNKVALNYSFAPRVVDGYAYDLNTGMVGLGSDNSRGTFDNFTVQRVPPAWTLQQTQSFSSGTGAMFGGNETGAWTLSSGRYAGTAPGASLVDLGLARGLETDAVLELSATLSTDGAGGFVFDRYAADDYKFVVLDAAADQVILGHVTPKGGLTVDASFARTIDAGKDYALTLRLKGTSASVSLSGQALGGHVYNAVIVDGDFGLLAARGGSSFASATVKTSDSAFYVPGSAMIATAAAATASGPTLTQAELDSVAAFAISQWAEALGEGSSLLDALDGASFGIADLDGAELGFASGNAILIDADAAGWGWFIDASPASSSEFLVRLDSNISSAMPGSEAYGYMDLVTVVEHEVGHLLGFEHVDAREYAVMRESLDAGARYLLKEGRAAAADAQAFDAYAGYADAGCNAEINWQAASGADWAVKLSPYDAGSPGKKAWSNFTPFEPARAGASGDGGFDRMGRDLLGKGVRVGAQSPSDTRAADGSRNEVRSSFFV